MTEEMRLWATILPRIDLSSLKDAIKQGFQESISVSLQGAGASPGAGAGGGGGGGGGGAVSGIFVASDATTSTELARDMAQTQYDLYKTSGEAYDIKKGLEDSNRSADDVIGMADEEQAALQARRERQMGMVASGVQQLAGAGISLIKNTFGILQDIYNRMKAASPLLQSIEALFNLAMMLFFMPLGNKLAEVILPATLELVDAVVDMWDKFGDQSLPEMFNTAITEGVSIFGGYIENIGTLLSDMAEICASLTAISEMMLLLSSPAVSSREAISPAAISETDCLSELKPEGIPYTAMEVSPAGLMSKPASDNIPECSPTRETACLPTSISTG